MASKGTSVAIPVSTTFPESDCSQGYVAQRRSVRTSRQNLTLNDQGSKIARRRFCGGFLILKDHHGRHRPSVEFRLGPDLELAVLVAKNPPILFFRLCFPLDKIKAGTYNACLRKVL